MSDLNTIVAISDDEIELVDGAKLSAGEVVAYTLIGSVAVATGGVGCVIAGGFLLAMTSYLA